VKIKVIITLPRSVRIPSPARSNPEVHKRMLAGIAREAKGEAIAANAPKEPLLEARSGTDAVFNDPALTLRMAAAVRAVLGTDKVVEMPAQMGSEDFSQFGNAGVQAVLLHIGAVDAAKLEASRKSGAPVPSVHSAQFAPERDLTLRAAIGAEIAILLDLMKAR